MKKLLYLVPFLLIGLSATPVTLYKDKVDFLLSKNPNAKIEDLSGALTKLSPSHWKMLDYQTSADANLGSASFSLDSLGNTSTSGGNQTTETSKPVPLYLGATFRGFPFAAYFSKSSSTNTTDSSSSTSASGYSWLWAVVDGLLIIVSLVVSFKVNRKKMQPVQVTQNMTPQTPVDTGVAPTVTPQAGNMQTGVFTPTQPPTQPIQPTDPTPSQPTEPPQAPPQV